MFPFDDVIMLPNQETYVGVISEGSVYPIIAE